MAALRSASNVAPGHLAVAIRQTILLGQTGREIREEYPLASGARVRTVKIVATSRPAVVAGRFEIAPNPCDRYVCTPPEYTPVECGGEVDLAFDASPYVRRLQRRLRKETRSSRHRTRSGEASHCAA